MNEFSGADLDSHVPDDLTIAEFILEYRHPLRPNQGSIPCLIEDATGRTISLNELRQRTLGLAKSLNAKYKISENDVVLICSPNHVDYPVAIWATQYLGAMFTGANPSYTAGELVYQLKITEATLIIAHSSTLEAALKAASLAGLAPDRVIQFDTSPDVNVPTVSSLIADGISHGPEFVARKLGPGEGKTKVAALFMSSGTTGPPKAVAITHAAIIANLIQLSFMNQDARHVLCPGDVAMAILPFFHVAGMAFNLHWMLFCGTSVVVVQKFDFIAMLESIVRHRIQHIVLVPPIAVALCKNSDAKKYDLGGIKFIECGAAPMTSELQDQLKRLCPQAIVGQAYGMTEVAGILTMTSLSRPFSCGSVGALLPGVKARVLKSDGGLAGCNELGELMVKTPSLSLGYHKNQQASNEAFVDGWYRTGDEVKIDENGEVWITDRLKELIKVRGFQVSPAELEGLILNHPDVSDACVVGVPDESSGEVPRAFIVLTEAAKAKRNPELIRASISKHVADNKIKYKHLAGGVEIIPAIPKNMSGKILRRILREQEKEKLRAKL